MGTRDKCNLKTKDSVFICLSEYSFIKNKNSDNDMCLNPWRTVKGQLFHDTQLTKEYVKIKSKCFLFVSHGYIGHFSQINTYIRLTIC